MTVWECVMAAHKTNSLLKWGVAAVVIILLIVAFSGKHSSQENTKPLFSDKKTKNTASNDSAAESLDTLTAELSSTKQQVAQITKDNAQLKKQNDNLLSKLQGAEVSSTAALKAEVDQLKNQIESSHQKSNDYLVNTANVSPQVITTVPDLTQPLKTNKTDPFNIFGNSNNSPATVNQTSDNKKSKPIPFYTIPPNATAVHDRLMIALVGRIPVKGVVTDPYPFKIVFSDDTLAANGLRIPNLRQMVVSGYTEGDLNLSSVRGWVTSLTFVFNDGTIATATSNNNDIGHFTKENALGYLSDKWGNPFLRGKLITNAPAYLGGNILLGAAQGAASAYAQEQTTSQNSILGTNTSSVTGSPGKFVLGQAGISAANQAQQWWHDREEQSFDAIYVPTVQPNGEFTEIVVNFTKEIDIDYNVQGRKIAYANTGHPNVNRSLD